MNRDCCASELSWEDTQAQGEEQDKAEKKLRQGQFKSLASAGPCELQGVGMTLEFVASTFCRGQRAVPGGGDRARSSQASPKDVDPNNSASSAPREAARGDFCLHHSRSQGRGASS